MATEPVLSAGQGGGALPGRPGPESPLPGGGAPPTLPPPAPDVDDPTPDGPPLLPGEQGAAG